MVSDDDHIIAKNVLSPLFNSLHNGVQLFFTRRITSNHVVEYFGMKCNWVTGLSDHDTEGINLKGLMQIR